ncbi:MAG: hypothetical protein V3V08_01100 [Nannocystaceae bacterium]
MFRPGTKPFLPAAILGIGIGAVSGCEPSPSYELRWRLQPRDGSTAPRLDSVSQCASVGIATIRTEVFHAGTTSNPIDVREYPCFPDTFAEPAGRVPGIVLDDGSYALVATGLSRRREPYAVDDIRPTASEPTNWARPTAALVVEEGTVAELDNLRIFTPWQCVDGIDNDLDGVTDAADPACFTALACIAEGPDAAASDCPGTTDREVTESQDPHASAQFRIATSFFDHHPDATCAGMGIGRMSIRIDGVEVLCTSCTTDWIQHSEVLGPGEHLLEVVASRNSPDADESKGPDCGIARSHPAALLFSDRAVEFEADFDLDDLLYRINGPISGSVVFEADPLDDTISRTCLPATSLWGGRLVVDEVRLRVINTDTGKPIDPAWLNLENAEIADDDSVAAPCTPGHFRSEYLDWGHYRLEGEARSQGTVCFANGFGHATEALNLAPFGDNFRDLVLSRVLDGDGAAPSGCWDCETDEDCKFGAHCDPLRHICAEDGPGREYTHPSAATHPDSPVHP